MKQFNSQPERFEMSQDFFDLTVGEILLATSRKPDFPDMLGVPIYVNQHMPKDMAVFIDSEGRIVKIFKLE